jgi:hypothetical protein
MWAAAGLFAKHSQVTIETWGEQPELTPSQYKKLLATSTNRNLRNTVVVYPDCVKGNPLNAKRVARYLMCKPHILNGESIDYSFGDYLFAYSRAVNKNLVQYHLLLDKKFTKVKIPSEPRKNKVCIYYGKIRISEGFDHVYEILKKFDDVYVITRSYPAVGSEMYKHLAESRLLISLDPLSYIGYEATLLGTPVYFADDVFRGCYEDYNYPLDGFYYQNNIEHALTDFDHEKLSSDSRKCFIDQAGKNEEQTIELMSKIEEYFSQKGVKINYSEILNEDIDFYENDWKMSPIYIPTTYNSVIGYHILRKSVYLYMLAIWVRGACLWTQPLTKRFQFFVRNSFRFIAGAILTAPDVYSSYLYHKRFDVFKIRRTYERYKISNMHSDDQGHQNTNSHKKQILSTKLLSTKLIKLLWRI